MKWVVRGDGQVRSERSAAGTRHLGLPESRATPVRVVRRGARSAWPRSATWPTSPSAAWSSSPTGWPSRCSSRDRPGTGKTQLAKSVAELTGARLIRLQCYEGLDESKALYEWNYRKQLLRIQAGRARQGARARAAELVRARGGHLLRGVPPGPPAARGHPRHRARRAPRRRGGPRRARDRGAAARDPLRVPGLHPRAGHRAGDAAAHGVPRPRTTPASSPRRSSGGACTSTSTTPTSTASARSCGPRCPASARSWPTRWPASCARCAPSSCARRRRSPRPWTGRGPW